MYTMPHKAQVRAYTRLEDWQLNLVLTENVLDRPAMVLWLWRTGQVCTWLLAGEVACCRVFRRG